MSDSTSQTSTPNPAPEHRSADPTADFSSVEYIATIRYYLDELIDSIRKGVVIEGDDNCIARGLHYNRILGEGHTRQAARDLNHALSCGRERYPTFNDLVWRHPRTVAHGVHWLGQILFKLLHRWQWFAFDAGRLKVKCATSAEPVTIRKEELQALESAFEMIVPVVADDDEGASDAVKPATKEPESTIRETTDDELADTQCKRHILATIDEIGRRMTTKKLLEEMEHRERVHGGSTVKNACSAMRKAKQIDNCQKCRPKGYGRPAWPHTHD